VKVLNEFDQSERNFNQIFQLIRQERIETEEAYQKLLATPAKSILKFDRNKEEEKSQPEKSVRLFSCEEEKFNFFFTLI
jgi:hypothetical protein